MDMLKISNDLVASTRLAIQEYLRRHNGDMPAKILLSGQAYAAMASYSVHFVITPKNDTLFGIPVQCCNTDGYHIHLAEPEIPIYDFPGKEPVKLYWPPKDQKTEGTE